MELTNKKCNWKFEKNCKFPLFFNINRQLNFNSRNARMLIHRWWPKTSIFLFIHLIAVQKEISHIRYQMSCVQRCWRIVAGTIANPIAFTMPYRDLLNDWISQSINTWKHIRIDMCRFISSVPSLFYERGEKHTSIPFPELISKMLIDFEHIGFGTVWWMSIALHCDRNWTENLGLVQLKLAYIVPVYQYDGTPIQCLAFPGKMVTMSQYRKKEKI